MSVRGILCYPHPLLKTLSRPIHDFDVRAQRHMKSLWTDLRDTSSSCNAAALSAVQIGAQWAAIYVSQRVDGIELFLVNPIIVERGEMVQQKRETCASTPGIDLSVQRAASITVAARKTNGDDVTIAATGDLAQCLQHEIQHLNGKSLIDCASSKTRLYYESQVAKYGGKDGAVLTY